MSENIAKITGLATNNSKPKTREFDVKVIEKDDQATFIMTVETRDTLKHKRFRIDPGHIVQYGGKLYIVSEVSEMKLSRSFHPVITAKLAA